jgi:hypothetical protein
MNKQDQSADQAVRINPDIVARYREAYLFMASIKYRPGAPSDGLGSVYLSKEEAQDKALLEHEATDYAIDFYLREQRFLETAEQCLWVGRSNFETNRAFMWIVEAARMTMSSTDEPIALKLLKKAIAEIEDVRKQRELRNRRIA